MADKEEKIRAKAYELWEQAGRPEGRQSEHWEEAERLVEAEDNAGPVNPSQTGPAQPSGTDSMGAGGRKRAMPGKAGPSSQPRRSAKTGTDLG